MKLFLYSLNVTEAHWAKLETQLGKEARDTTVGLIENAADVIPGSESWLGAIRGGIASRGFEVEAIDLRKCQAAALHRKLAEKDIIWVGGGNTYYLRWILSESGADAAIGELVRNGKVYAGWSAGAVVAGPTTLYFDLMGDDPKDAPQLITDGLDLTDFAVVPHVDHPDFAGGAELTKSKLSRDGFSVKALRDSDALFIHGQECLML